ncbi:MAG: glycosyl hydrolase family protein [Sphingobacteriaceae bacterium]|nr:MAG: glycosyl hydrolase family protein [Sphingobacteriaceae bacterium]
MKNKFMFATGIENSYPTVFIDGKKVRVDEMEKTGHYKNWQQDFQLVKDMEIEFLRYGPPYFSTHTGPGQYNWSFADETFARLKELDITPIVDLCHFGVPDWLDSFQNPDFPQYFAEYALAFAQRYPHLKFYTPVNEIFVAASFSGQYGWWNESLADDKSFVTALKYLCKANVLAMEVIAKVQPEVTFIQSESSEYFHAEDPNCRAQADFLNLKRFLSLDLSYAHAIKVPHYKYLMENGMTNAEYEWFMNNQIRGRCIMGTDYYASNEHIVHADGSTSASGEIFGYYVITQQYYTRYRLPVMHTETNIAEPNSVAWLQKEWANLYRFKQDGFPIVGFTWFGLLDQVDWDTALRQNNGHVNPLGLYDLDRKIRPVGTAYKKLITDWRIVLDEESYGLNIIS